MAEIKEAIRRLIYQYLVEGADKLLATQDAIAASNTATEKAALSLEKSFGNLERRYVDTVRHQQEYLKVVERVNAAVTQNPALQERANVVLAAATKRYQEATGSTEKLAQQTGLARHELINLGRQAQDVGVSLASGQSPFMVLVQQGTQIADVFATSGGTVRGFFSQAIGWAGAFLTSTGGIITALVALGGAAIYALSQFVKSAPTIEQALEKQNQLLAEGKALVEAKSAAEVQMLLRSKDQTRIEMLENERLRQQQLQSEMEKTLQLATKIATTPTQVPGEMGEAPTGVAALKDPGYAEIAAAVENLRARWAAGQLGVREFNNEVSRVKEIYPALTDTVNKMLEYGAAGAALELNNLRANEATDAYRRQGDAIRELIELYPGVSVEVAKQLQSQEDQLKIAQARTPEEKLIAEQLALQNKLHLEGKTAEEQRLILAGQRAIAEQNITNSMNRGGGGGTGVGGDLGATLYGGGGASGGGGGGSSGRGGDNSAFQTGVGGDLGATLYGGRGGGGSSSSSGSGGTYQDKLGRVWRESSGAIAREIMDVQFFDIMGNTVYEFGQAATDSAKSLRDAGDAAEDLAEETGELAGKFGKLGSIAEAVAGRLDLLDAQFDETGYESSYDPLNISTQKRNLESRYGAGNVEAVTHGVGAGQFTSYRVKADAKLAGSLDKLTDSTDSLNATMQDALSPYYSQDPRTTKLGFRAGTVGNPDWLTGAGNANPLDAILGKGATLPSRGAAPASSQAPAGMMDFPGWGQWPGFADGGSFVVGGGYSANDNKMAMFPVASGEEVMINRTPQRQGRRAAQVVNIDNRIIINGSLDADALAQMKISRYQQAQRMRAGMAA